MRLNKIGKDSHGFTLIKDYRIFPKKKEFSKEVVESQMKDLLNVNLINHHAKCNFLSYQEFIELACFKNGIP
jgi:hypothetical protein